MSRWVGAVLLVSSVVGVAGAGCGESIKTNTPSAGGETFVDGTRLKARWFQPPGVRRIFGGWFDQQLGENCEFERVAHFEPARPPGTPLYCRPRAGSGTGEVFADAACTQAVVDAPCDDVHFVNLPPTDSNDCASPNRLFRVGDPVLTGMVYARVEGICTRLAPTDPMTPRSPRHLGAELTLDAMVSATAEMASGSGRIVSIELVASDGSRRVVGARDTQRGEDVFAPNWYRDAFDGGRGKWEPVQIVMKEPGAPVFSDAACTAVAAPFASCGDVAIRSVFEPESGCWPSAKYYEAGAKLGPGSAYVDYGASCRAATAAEVPPDQQVAIGAPISPTSFADVTAWEESSPAGVRVRRAGTSDGPVGADEYILDSNFGDACGPVLAADGVLRCLPRERVGTTYADAGCTMPVVAVSQGASPCPTFVPPIVGIAEVITSTDCAYQERVHEFPVGAEHTGPVYGPGASGPCTVLSSAVLEGARLYVLGTELPPDRFAALTTSTPF